jgi:uncharacterized protein YndB with AHSA1/START domain
MSKPSKQQRIAIALAIVATDLLVVLLLWAFVGVWYALAAFVVLAGAAVLFAYSYGRRMPEGHRASGSALVAAPIAEVFALHADPRKRPEFVPQVKEIRDFKDEGDGKASWTELWKDRNTFRMRLAECEQDRRLTMEIQVNKNVFHGTWTFEFAEEEGGTRVTITEDGRIPSPLTRGVYNLLADTDETLRKYLENLKAHYARAA